MRLGQLLLQANLLTPDQLEQALAEQRRAGGRLGLHLLKLGWIDRETLHWHLAQQQAQKAAELKQSRKLAALGQLLGRFWQLDRSQALISIGLLGLAVALNLVLPYYVKIVFDGLQQGLAWVQFFWLGLAVGLCQVLAAIANYYAQTTFNRLNLVFASQLRQELFQASLAIHHSDHDQFPSGDLLNRSSTDVENVTSRWEHIWLNFFKNLFSISFSCGLLIAIDPLLTALVLGISLVIVLIPGKISNRANPQLAKRPEFQSHIISRFSDYLQGIRVIKAFNRQSYVQDFFQGQFKPYYRNDLQMVTFWNVAFNLRSVLGGLLSGLVLFIGAKNVIAGSYSLGDLSLMLLVVNTLAPYIDEWMQLMIKLNDLKRYWLRVQELTERNLDQRMFEPITTQAKLAGNIRVQNVSLGYAGQIVLANLTLTLEAGKSYGLIGRSGSGKSSFINGLTGQLPTSSGTIWLADQPLDQLHPHQIAANISLISQQPHMFNTSIQANLAWGVEGFGIQPSQADLIAVAQRAGIHERIEQLPEGYATTIGEAGTTLSGGEQQRLAIARGLLKQPMLMIFDEPTAALDSANEALVLASIQALFGQTTVLLATHNLALLEQVDTVIMLDQGQARCFERNQIELNDLIQALENANPNSQAVGAAA